jgi:Bacterial Ig domain
MSKGESVKAVSLEIPRAAHNFRAGIPAIILLSCVLLGNAGQIFYSVNFDSPLNQIGQPPVTGLRLRTPSSVVFGSPKVVSSFGHLSRQPLRFSGLGYQQIQFDLGKGVSDYFLDFDFETHNLNPSLFCFTILFDTPLVQNFDLHGLGFIQGPPVDSSELPGWSDDQPHHIHIDVNLFKNQWTLDIDQRDPVTGIFSSVSGDVLAIRMNLSTWRLSTPDDPNVQIAIDNILIGTSDPPAPTGDQVSVVNLLVLYTPQASQGAGGIAAIHKEIDQAVLEANTVLQNSRANVRVKVSLVARLDFPESGDAAQDFNRLMDPHDRFYNPIRSFRAAAKADLVCLVTETSPGGYYGARGPSFSNAFNVIRRQFLTGEYHFPVLLSHNFGCQPERRATLETSPFPYGYGFTFYTATNEWFSTIESGYTPRVPFFSNPHITYKGVPMGIPEGQTNAANNVAVLNEQASLIAGFYQPSPFTFPPSVFLLSPTSNQIFKAGENVRLTAAATDFDGRVARVEYWLQAASEDYYNLRADLPTNRLATSTGASKYFPALWRRPPQGNYSLVAVAIDNQGATSISDPVPFSVVPSNDNFADAQIISGSFITVTNSATAATLEPGEPFHPGGDMNWGSIWWSWTAPVSGWASLSSYNSISRVLNVYEGTALTNLSEVAGDPYGGAIPIGFETVAGKTYYIAGTAPYGEYVLNIDLSTIVLTSPTNGAHFPYGTPIPISLTTTENEGRISYVEFFANGRFLASVENPPYSMLWTNARPGDGYYIVGHVVTASGRSLWASTPMFSVGPPNDDFAPAQIITNLNTLITNTLDGATFELGEPLIADGYSNSVWLSFTAPQSGVVSVFGSGFDYQTFEVFAGNSLADLSLITNSLHRLTFDATEGTTYSLRVSGSPYDVLFRFFFSSFEITSPPPGAQFPSGSNIPIAANFTQRDEQNGPIPNVKFYANNVLLGTVYDPPYTFVWSNVVAGSYDLRAVGTNNYDFLSHASAPVPIAVLPP